MPGFSNHHILYCFVVFAPNKHILYNLVMHFAYTNLDNSDVYCDGQIILTKFLLISRRDKKINVKNIIDMWTRSMSDKFVHGKQFRMIQVGWTGQGVEEGFESAVIFACCCHVNTLEHLNLLRSLCFHSLPLTVCQYLWYARYATYIPCLYMFLLQSTTN